MKEYLKHKLISEEDLDRTISRWRFEKHKIVFTNGCFDLIHQGHIDYLAKARSLGDKMIIGLNSDSSVKELKGESRPLKDELSRSLILASLFFVDAVILFSENTPFELINRIKPDILVKGADYDVSEIVGADVVLKNGGEVKTIPFLEGYSTTKIIEKIKQ